MILSLYLVSQNTCAAQFASNTADVDIATQVGCYADGDAGVDSDNSDDDLCLFHVTWATAMERGGQPENKTSCDVSPSPCVFQPMEFDPEDERCNT